MTKSNLIELEGAKLNESKSFNFEIDNIKINKEERNKNVFWIDKYAPTRTNDIDSNMSIISEIKSWLNNFYKIYQLFYRIIF